MSRLVAVLAGLGVSAGIAIADDERARVNYMLHCQGCHLADAAGFPDRVPRMKDFVGYFMHSRDGREFLIRVPGVATSSLPDDELTELMNWLLETYSAGELPDDYEPFSIDEVASLRARLEPDPEAARTRILEDIASARPALARAIVTTIHNNDK